MARVSLAFGGCCIHPSTWRLTKKGRSIWTSRSRRYRWVARSRSWRGNGGSWWFTDFAWPISSGWFLRFPRFCHVRPVWSVLLSWWTSLAASHWVLGWASWLYQAKPSLLPSLVWAWRYRTRTFDANCCSPPAAAVVILSTSRWPPVCSLTVRSSWCFDRSPRWCKSPSPLEIIGSYRYPSLCLSGCRFNTEGGRPRLWGWI